jgi:hypothetical protein
MRQQAIEQLEARTLLTGDVDLALAFGGPLPAYIQETAIDAQGNIYVAGSFDGTLTFGRRKLQAQNIDVFVGKYSPAGRLLWARSVGGDGTDEAGGLAIDPEGNVIVVGRFTGEADFDPSAREHSLRSRGRSDAFVWKLDSRGQLLWAHRAGGKRDDAATAVTTDADGNLFVAGFFRQTLLEGRWAVPSGKGRTGFVWSTRPDGLTRFARSFGGAGTVNPNDISLDSAGNILTAGSFAGVIDFAPGKPQSWRMSADAAGLFVSRLSPAGKYAGALTIGGAGLIVANAVAADAEGNLWITGQFEQDADFDPTAGNTVLSAGGAFIAKYDSRWALQLAKRIGDTPQNGGTSLKIDPAGAAYVAGYYSGSPDFDIGNGVYRMTAAGETDGFLLKITNAGKFSYVRGRENAPVKSIALGSANEIVLAGGGVTRLAQDLPDYSLSRLFGDGNLQVQAMAVDDADDLYITGTFSGTLTFGAGAGQVQFTSAGGTDVFIGKFCNKCNITWGRVIGGPGDDTAADIALGSDGSIAVTGIFQETADFDPGAGTHDLTSAGGDDVFLLKLNAAGGFAWAERIGEAHDDIAGAVAMLGKSVYLGATVLDSSTALANTFIASYGDIGPTWRADGQPASRINDLLISIHGLHVAGQTEVDGIVWKMDAAGASYWTHPIAGKPSAARKLALSPSGSLYVAGSGQLLELADDGTPRRTWDLGKANAAAVAVDAFGNPYLTGTFTGATSLGSLSLQSAGGEDLFLAKLSANGQWIWAGVIGGTGADRPADLTTGGSSSFIYVLGEFTDSADLDPTNGIHEQSADGLAGFLTRLVV